MVEILQFMLIAVFAGFLGSLVGLGGGIIITPALTILFGFDIKICYWSKYCRGYCNKVAVRQ